MFYNDGSKGNLSKNLNNLEIVNKKIANLTKQLITNNIIIIKHLDC